MKRTAVLVTTEKKGVFFGYVEDISDIPNSITLYKCRNCIYWSSDMKGFLGLAKLGPSKDCTIGIEHDEFTLFKLTGIGPVTKEAEERWVAHD